MITVLVVPTAMETMLLRSVPTGVPVVSMALREFWKSVSGNGTKNCCTTCCNAWAVAVTGSAHAKKQANKVRASLICDRLQTECGNLFRQLKVIMIDQLLLKLPFLYDPIAWNDPLKSRRFA